MEMDNFLRLPSTPQVNLKLLKMLKTSITTLAALLVSVASFAFVTTSDSTETVVQVSGVVVTGDSLAPLAYATVFRSRDKRGTMTDQSGFFSLPALEGDTISFSSTGYITRTVVIPSGGERGRISLVQAMSRDTVMINDAYIYLYHLKKDLDKNFLRLDLMITTSNLATKLLTLLIYMTRLFEIGFDNQGAITHDFKQMSINASNAGSYPSAEYGALLNPVAWAKFIKALKNGDLKRE